MCATMGPDVHPPLGQSGDGGGADVVPGCCGGTLRVGEIEDARYGLETERVVVHVHGREGSGICVLICRPRSDRLDGVEDLKKGLERGRQFCS